MSIVATWIDSLAASNKLSKGTIAVLNAISADPERASYCNTQQLAETAGVNAATVVRAAQAIGFAGWPALSTEVRNRFLSSLDVRKHYEHASAGRSDRAITGMSKDAALLQVLAETLQEDDLVRIARIIAESRMSTVLATGSWAGPAQLLAHNSRGLGFNIAFEGGSVTTMLNAVRLLHPGDCLVAISVWKTSTAIYQMCRIAHERGVKIIVIADQHSHLADLADELLLVPSEGMGPMASATCAVSLVQCIVTALADLDPERSAARLEELDDLWRQTGAVMSG
ncbi:MurR/RpiR family transcriptional regulator [Brevibacterium sp. 50QC2O2]|uniref:MurR/RpiR family transcriptional regulator n=1 Tax=Brevibacterium TaxID=1696 RepID=UPI00211D0AE2|nr:MULTISPECIES: MurR/RpiR family transcriptional regulator [unclassified Brevibacterium]MCQ9368760.1 MurR/RpiR family transcriptional regulator [Brevibacterium sp. 91QC2O2]MCQ9386819.1 MurR/RpiR family transcriptional regulator [Brevibacterium sp. 68QC2CO]MCQ9389742.1 MurR/RpiR family transcriptional regulator [Brevibacterium sp. 50QC2O2]